MRSFVWCSFLVAACAAGPTDDESLDGEDLTGKADGISFSGTYLLAGVGQVDGDIPSLALAGDGSYVRARCYGTACAKLVPETDRYKLVKASSGKTYVRFERFAWTDFDNRESEQEVVDSYEIKKVDGGIALRKTYSSRWLTLSRRIQRTVCTASSGTWKPDEELLGAEAGTTTHCDCGPGHGEWGGPAFVPGAGGCIDSSMASEQECDDTRGRYVDDDRDKLGDYCLCPIDTAPTDDGCAAI